MKSQKLKNWIIKVFGGMYGFDNLYFVLFGFIFLLAVINLFVHTWILWLIEALTAGYMIFRIFSHNRTARKRENDFVFGLFKRAGRYFALQKTRFRDRKTHIYRKCPVCHAVIRLPKKQGKEKKSVICPRCGREFKV